MHVQCSCVHLDQPIMLFSLVKSFRSLKLDIQCTYWCLLCRRIKQYFAGIVLPSRGHCSALRILSKHNRFSFAVLSLNGCGSLTNVYCIHGLLHLLTISTMYCFVLDIVCCVFWLSLYDLIYTYRNHIINDILKLSNHATLPKQNQEKVAIRPECMS